MRVLPKTVLRHLLPRSIGRLLALALVIGTSTLRAQEPTSAVFHKTSEFWIQSEDRRLVPHPADLTITVAFCDPPWHVMWGFEDGAGVFLPLGDKPLNLMPGQRVRLQGMLSTAAFDISKITVLGTAPLVAPIDVTKHIMAWQTNNLKEVAFDAYVDRQVETDSSHTLLSVIVGGHRIAVRVLNRPSVSAPAFEGAFVHIQGLYIWTGDAGAGTNQIQIFVTGFAQVHVLGWLSSDHRFDNPVSAIDSLNTVQEGTLVHVAGRVETSAPGDKVVLRDSTGQLDVASKQTEPLRHGEEIEAIGRVNGRGPNLHLTGALYRKAGPVVHTLLSAQARSLRLRLTDDITNLSLAEAAKGYAVRLTAAVTWSNPQARFFFVQDASGGVRVDLASANLPTPEAGQLVDITGTTRPGAFAPEVAATDVRNLSDLSLPPPRRLTLDQAMTGYADETYVEIEGYLRITTPDGPWLSARLSTPSGNFSAFLPAGSNLANALHAVVLVRGVCTRVADERGQPGNMVLWVQSSAGVNIESAYPAKQSAVPWRSISELNRFSGRTPTQWVRTSGIVTLQSPGRYLYLQEGEESIKVLSRETKTQSPGSRVELMGLLGREGTHFVLREATVLKSSPGPDLPSLWIEPASKPSDSLDGRLVRVGGTLVDVSPRLGHLVCVLQNGPKFVEAHLPLSTRQDSHSFPALGSLVAATGVYRLQYDEYKHPTDFEVSLRSPSDIVVLRSPPWWTPARALVLSISLLVSLLLGLLWVSVLRRKVAQQTRVIRNQLEKEVKLVAELERTSRLESLGMLAGGIAHDFNNLLTIIIGNLTLSRMEEGVTERAGPFLDEAHKGAQRARVLAQKLLTFARGGNPIRRPEPLPELVREAAASATEDRGDARIAFDFDEGLWTTVLDRNQMIQAIHNLAIHSLDTLPKGGSLSFRAWNASIAEAEIGTLKAGCYVHLVIEDSGPGMDPKALRQLFDPYSGLEAGRQGLDLAVVRSIVRRHDGHIDVESASGSGTRFHLWIPATRGAPEPAESAAPCATPCIPGNPIHGRILFMDDDEAIRNLASKTLTRIGCNFELASDGVDAVRRFQDARTKGTPFDLVVLDLTVPGGMGGRETIRQLREIDPQVRAIVSSGYSSDPVLSEYQLHGFAAFVPKPYSVDEFEACIRRILRDHQHA